MKSHYATVSTEQPCEVRPQGSSCVVPEIPQAGADGAGGNPSSRSSAADCGGKRVGNHLRKGCGRSCAHVHQLSSPSEHQPDRSVAEGNEFARVAPGVSASEEAVLGQAPVGEGIFRC